MLGKILEKLYNKVFVTIIIQKHTVDVGIEIYTKKGVVQDIEEHFETAYINNAMVSFITKYTADTPFYYVSILDASQEQGVIPTCSKHLFPRYHDVSECEYKCHNKEWVYYTSKTDLYEIEKTYQELGIDFIFSPFSVLNKFFQDKISSHLALYVLVQESSLSLSIFEKGKLLFGQYFDMENLEETEDLLLESVDEVISLDMEDGIDLEDIDVIEEMDNVDDMEDFGDIEDLDSLEDIDEFSEDIEEEFYQESEEEIKENTSSDSFNKDYQRFSSIQSAVNYFYKDEKFESKFIEHVYIADATGISSDLKTYLEEEMFLTVYIRQIDLVGEVTSLAREEMGL